MAQQIQEASTLRFAITTAQMSSYLDIEKSSMKNSDLEFLEFVFQN